MNFNVFEFACYVNDMVGMSCKLCNAGKTHDPFNVPLVHASNYHNPGTLLEFHNAAAMHWAENHS